MNMSKLVPALCSLARQFMLLMVAAGLFAGLMPDGTWAQEVRIVELETLGGADVCPKDINDSGVIVGFSDAASTRQHAFLRQADGTMVDLTPGNEHFQCKAAAVNGDGVAVGTV